MKGQELPVKTLLLVLVIAIIAVLILYGLSTQGFSGFKSIFFKEAFSKVGIG